MSDEHTNPGTPSTIDELRSLRSDLRQLREDQSRQHDENAERLRRIEANLGTVVSAYKSHAERLTRLERRVFGNGGSEPACPVNGDGGLEP